MTTPLIAQRLRELLHYDPRTGLFTWRVRRNQHAIAGAMAGSSDGKGYIQTRIDGVKHRNHRLAWLYMKGEWPSFELDHRNRVKNDNRWKNLRPATRSTNLQNQACALSNNKTGLLGVSKRKNRFFARIKLDGQPVYLGCFVTADDAHEAYIQAKREFHAGCTI